ncbi:hypothetical protein BD779DRAFT_1667044 [Infundibulicybe gibba]|nr:hypothetical protein BD779DRAFT_1667044 [Infundibulicybe gibba]
MARIDTFLFTLLGFFLACVRALPQSTSDPNFVGEVINALQVGLVKDINAFITLDSLTTNIISVNFDAKNPLIFELTIDRVMSSAGLNGTVFATFDQTFSKPVVVPPLGTKNSGTFGNVLLPQGATASLDIIPFGELDLISTDVFLRAATIGGKLGIPIPITGLKQSDVPTVYTLDLS